MAAQRSKSRKGSDANSGSTRPHDDLVFFLDKCLGRNTVANALRECGVKVEVKEDHFPPDTEDAEWLPAVGGMGWKVLSKDNRLRHNNIELMALLKSNTHSFILTSATQTGSGMAVAFKIALPSMKRLIEKFEPPMIATVSAGGVVSVHLTKDQLLAKIAEKCAAEENIASFAAAMKGMPPA